MNFKQQPLGLNTSFVLMMVTIIITFPGTDEALGSVHHVLYAISPPEFLTTHLRSWVFQQGCLTDEETEDQRIYLTWRPRSYEVAKTEANLGLIPELTVEKEATLFQGDVIKGGRVGARLKRGRGHMTERPGKLDGGGVIGTQP